MLSAVGGGGKGTYLAISLKSYVVYTDRKVTNVINLCSENNLPTFRLKHSVETWASYFLNSSW